MKNAILKILFYSPLHHYNSRGLGIKPNQEQHNYVIRPQRLEVLYCVNDIKCTSPPYLSVCTLFAELYIKDCTS